MIRDTLRAFDSAVASQAPHINVARITAAFRDVDHLIDLYREYSGRSKLPDDWALGAQDMPADIHERMEVRNVLHMAVIEFLYIALTIGFHEFMGRPSGQFALRKGLADARASRLRDGECWHEVYLLSVYRHKVIVHHDAVRVRAWLGNGRSVRLVPLPPGLTMSSSNRELVTQTAATFGLDPSANEWELIYEIHKLVRYTPGEPACALRLKIDRAIEEGGIPSPTVDEIDRLIDCAITDLPNLLQPERQAP